MKFRLLFGAFIMAVSVSSSVVVQNADVADVTRSIAATKPVPLSDLNAKSYAAVVLMGSTEADTLAEEPPPPFPHTVPPSFLIQPRICRPASQNAGSTTPISAQKARHYFQKWSGENWCELRRHSLRAFALTH